MALEYLRCPGPATRCGQAPQSLAVVFTGGSRTSPAVASAGSLETAAGSDVIAAAGAGASGGSVATAFSSQGGSSTATAAVNEHKDVGRNDPCWCGSGKKFKKCHGA